ncbi:MAG: hypothetical protein EOP56_13085 [Sphingobacteriales bacterium]|nr:MAG: hypothetical protein EOP56_13085 [Sphingobacteriales bacterium]
MYLHLYMGVIVPLGILLPLTIALRRYKYLPVALKWFIGYLLLGVLTNVIVKTLATQGINNMPVFHVYTILEFSLLSIFFRQLFFRRLHLILPIIAVVFTVFCLTNMLLWQPISEYNSYSRSAEAILIMVYAIIYFKEALDDQHAIPQKLTVTWINAGLLLYFSGSLFLFICGNYILANVSLNTIIWNIHASMVLLMYILFAVGFYYAKRTV